MTHHFALESFCSVFLGEKVKQDSKDTLISKLS